MSKKNKTKSNKKAELVEIEVKAAVQIKKIEAWTKLIVPIIRTLTVGFLIFYLIYSINNYLSHDAEKLGALAKVLEMLKFDRILPWVAASATTLGWWKERKAKQRAIKKKSEFQKLAEKNDEYRSSSGLTSIGTTPS